MRFLPAFIAVVLFHVMALVSTVFSLGPYFWRIFWGGGLDPFLLAVLLVLSFLPNFVLGAIVFIGSRLRFRKASGSCFKNFLVGSVAFVFTGVLIGLAIDSLFGNSNYILYVGWVAISFPIQLGVAYLGLLSTYLVIALIVVMER